MPVARSLSIVAGPMVSTVWELPFGPGILDQVVAVGRAHGGRIGGRRIELRQTGKIRVLVDEVFDDFLVLKICREALQILPEQLKGSDWGKTAPLPEPVAGIPPG